MKTEWVKKKLKRCKKTVERKRKLVSKKGIKLN